MDNSETQSTPEPLQIAYYLILVKLDREPKTNKEASGIHVKKGTLFIGPKT